MSFLYSRPMAFVLVVLLQAVCNLSPVSAQVYLNNHQQFMHSLDWENIVAQAIDNADKGMYGITGTIKPSFLDLVQRPILAKLGKNKPLSNPFDIQWAVTYLTPGESNNEPSYLDFNVRDVLFTREEGYVIAGQVRFLDSNVYSTGGGGRYFGFLLHTDSMGSPMYFKFYDQLEILTSIIQNPQGDAFSAVGASYGSEDVSGQPAILNVQYDLSVICSSVIYGAFDPDIYPQTSGILNKVVIYSDQLFIAVGQVTGNDNTVKGGTDTDVLFTSFDQTCYPIVQKQHGVPRIYNEDQKILNTEVGNSITVQGQRALITGYATSYDLLAKSYYYQDVLFMSLKISDGSRFASFRYDIQQQLDVGMAITWRGDTGTALIAGETQTREILGSGGSKDIFLLEVEPLGPPQKIELFGTAKTDEFHVDLTLSQDKNAVMLSNTPINHICDDHGPWLIERYNQVTQRCRDAPYDVSKEKLKMITYDPFDKYLVVDEKEMELIAKNVMLEQWIWCPKLKL